MLRLPWAHHFSRAPSNISALSTAFLGRTPRQALTLSSGSPCSFGRLGYRRYEFDLSEDPQLVPVASVRYPDVRGPSGFTTRRCWYPERFFACVANEIKDDRC